MDTSRVRATAMVALAATALAGTGRATAAEELTYDGAIVMGKRVVAEAAPVFEKKTGVKFARIDLNGAGKGLKAVLSGAVSVAGVSRSLVPEDLAGQAYFRVIGYDALTVVVNERNPLTALTKAQLKAIFTGKARSWKDVGGPALPIEPCGLPPHGGLATSDTFKALVLDGEEFGPMTERNDVSECVKLVARARGAVTFAAMAEAKSAGVHAVAVDGVTPTSQTVRAGAYLLTRPLILVARERPTGALKKFYDFMLSADGQQIVSKSYVSLW